MIHRAIVRIDGPTGHGKTTFIERLLETCEEVAIVARGEAAGPTQRFCEHRSASDPELRRYRDAGAGDAARLRCRPGDDFRDDFFMSDFMQNYSEAVLIEGPGPDIYYELLVWVARPPADGGRLLVRQTYDRIAEARAEATALLLRFEEPGGVEEYITRAVGEPMALLLTQPAELQKLRGKMVAQLTKCRQQTGHEYAERWTLAPGYEGIVTAGMVVAAVHSEADRAAATTFIDDLHRLRTDRKIFTDIRGYRIERRQITALAANLADPRDPGTRKAVRRVRRDLKRGG